MSVLVNELKVKSIITKSNLPVSDYSLNPYVGCTHACKYCYASFMKRFTNHPEAWGDFLDVKLWPKIKAPKKYLGKELFLASVTDPYVPQEKIYKRTRLLLEQLQGSKIKLSIQTKSDLVLRDIDLLKTFPNLRVGFSINTLDEAFRRDMDKAVSIEQRLSAMKQLHEVGIRTTCFISPIFPEITEVKKIIEKSKDRCNLIWLENLNLRGSYKFTIINYIKEKYPQFASLYGDIYLKNNRSYWDKLDKELRSYAKEVGLKYVVNSDTMKIPFNAPPVVVNFFYHQEIKKSAIENRQENTHKNF